MIATIVITLVIAGLFALALRRVLRRGTCADCDVQGTCAVAGSSRCAQRSQSPDAGPVVLGMPGGLTRVTATGGACCPPAPAGDRAPTTSAATAAPVTAGR